MKEIIDVLPTLIAAIGLFFTGYQIYRSIRQRRVEITSAFLQTIHSDKRLQRTFYIIDQGKFSWNKDEFIGSDLEGDIDYLLSTFDILAREYQMDLIALKDIKYLSYEFLALYKNEELKKYFMFLAELSKKRGTGRMHYANFLEVAKLLEKHKKT